MVYDSYTGYSGKYTKLPIEIFTTDELCDEIIKRIQNRDFKFTYKVHLMYDLISAKATMSFCKCDNEELSQNG